MNYLKLPHMDSPVSVFDICQAHNQLEADYNVGGWVRERPSNQRRMEATACQLWRLDFEPRGRWVNIIPTADDDLDDPDDEAVRDIYLINVLKWGLPIDDDMRAFIDQRYTPEFLSNFPSWGKTWTFSKSSK